MQNPNDILHFAIALCKLITILSAAKIDEFFRIRGVCSKFQTSILTICVCFSNVCFGILMSINVYGCAGILERLLTLS